MNQKNLLEVDWSQIPAPADDGGAAHLKGVTLPAISLLATDDNSLPSSKRPRKTGLPSGLQGPTRRRS